MKKKYFTPEIEEVEVESPVVLGMDETSNIDIPICTDNVCTEDDCTLDGLG